jgi:hypothetical protein
MPLFQELDWFQQMQANMGNELANMEMCCFFFFAQPDMRFFSIVLSISFHKEQ